MPHILIIEDDPRLGPRLKRNLELSGFQVALASNGHSGFDCALSCNADLIVLDLMLPVIDGMDILTKLRKKQIETPVIILTAKGAKSERLRGFRTGCDDYITKPFSLRELIARIRAVLRRSGYQERKTVINSSGFKVDPNSRSVTDSGEQIELTPREFDLVYALASHPNQALSRDYLINSVWGDDSKVTNRTVDAHISYLRQKLNSRNSIHTVYKVGYMWSNEGEFSN